MDFVKENFFSRKENQHSQNKIHKPGQPLPVESLLPLTQHLHEQSVMENEGNSPRKFKPNASTPAAIWISMASLHEHFKKKPKSQKDAALADVGKVISDDFKFKLLNKEELEIDANFVNNLTNCVIKYLRNSGKPNTGCNRPSINIFLSAHGAPSWFFGPVNAYHYPKHGCIWPNFKFDGQSDDSKALLQTLTYSHFILTDEHVFYFNKTQRHLYQKIFPSIQNNDYWRYFNKTELKNAQDSMPSITSLNREELINLLNLFPKKQWDKFDSYHLKSFIQDECDYAKWMADAFKEVESRTQIEFTSVILFSCNSASEFLNNETFEASLSSARILSTLFRDRYVMGGIGLNANGKANGVYRYPKIGGDVPSPKLEKTLTVYRNERVVYRPSEIYYLKSEFFQNLKYMQYLNQDNEFLQSEYVLEHMEQQYHLIGALEHVSEFAGFQIKVLDKMLRAANQNNHKSAAPQIS
jgi:hypothetical protein